MEHSHKASDILAKLHSEIDKKQNALFNHVSSTAQIQGELQICQDSAFKLLEIIVKEGDRSLTEKELSILSTYHPSLTAPAL